MPLFKPYQSKEYQLAYTTLENALNYHLQLNKLLHSDELKGFIPSNLRSAVQASFQKQMLSQYYVINTDKDGSITCDIPIESDQTTSYYLNYIKQFQPWEKLNRTLLEQFNPACYQALNLEFSILQSLYQQTNFLNTDLLTDQDKQFLDSLSYLQKNSLFNSDDSIDIELNYLGQLHIKKEDLAYNYLAIIKKLLKVKGKLFSMQFRIETALAERDRDNDFISTNTHTSTQQIIHSSSLNKTVNEADNLAVTTEQIIDLTNDISHQVTTSRTMTLESKLISILKDADFLDMLLKDVSLSNAIGTQLRYDATFLKVQVDIIRSLGIVRTRNGKYYIPSARSITNLDSMKINHHYPNEWHQLVIEMLDRFKPVCEQVYRERLEVLIKDYQAIITLLKTHSDLPLTESDKAFIVSLRFFKNEFDHGLLPEVMPKKYFEHLERLYSAQFRLQDVASAIAQQTMSTQQTIVDSIPTAENNFSGILGTNAADLQLADFELTNEDIALILSDTESQTAINALNPINVPLTESTEDLPGIVRTTDSENIPILVIDRIKAIKFKNPKDIQFKANVKDHQKYAIACDEAERIIKEEIKSICTELANKPGPFDADVLEQVTQIACDKFRNYADEIKGQFIALKPRPQHTSEEVKSHVYDEPKIVTRIKTVINETIKQCAPHLVFQKSDDTGDHRSHPKSRQNENSKKIDKPLGFSFGIFPHVPVQNHLSHFEKWNIEDDRKQLELKRRLEEREQAASNKRRR